MFGRGISFNWPQSSDTKLPSSVGSIIRLVLTSYHWLMFFLVQILVIRRRGDLNLHYVFGPDAVLPLKFASILPVTRIYETASQ